MFEKSLQLFPPIVLSYVLVCVMGNNTDIEYANIPPVFHMDNFDECMFLKEKAALFCTFTYTLMPAPDNEVWKTIQKLSSEPYNYKHDRLRYGICVPRTCANIDTSEHCLATIKDGIKECYDKKFVDIGLSGIVSDLMCETKEVRYPVDGIDIFAGLLFFAYLVLVLYATFSDLGEGAAPAADAIADNILSSFSIRRNWNRLKTIRSHPDVERLKSIQGVRFMNTVLVVLTHTMMLHFMLPISNVKMTETLTGRLTTIFLTSGPLCVSTFYMISSWLLIHGIMEIYKDRQQLTKKELLMIFINRYLRLTPTLALVIAFTSTWLRHIGDGPKWNHYIGREYQRCRRNGWTNILFINNLIDPGNMCLQTTWYMGLELQYFAITLIIVAVTLKYPRLFWWLLGILLTSSIFLTFMENYEYDFPAILEPKPESLYDLNHTLKNKQWLIQYIGFRGNLAGPLIGLGFGYIYNKNKDKRLFTKKIHHITWWPITHLCTYGIILIPGTLTLSHSIEHSQFWASLHIAMSRPIFAFGIGFAILGITHGAGGFMKWLFEWPPLYILGRLTYSAYLVHIPLLLLKVGSVRTPVYLNDYNLFLDFVGSVAVTYLAATVLAVGFEMPMAELQKRLLSSIKDRYKTEDKIKKR